MSDVHIGRANWHPHKPFICTLPSSSSNAERFRDVKKGMNGQQVEELGRTMTVGNFGIPNMSHTHMHVCYDIEKATS